METLYEQIAHWKTIGEWENIKDVFVTATTFDRYFEITQFVNQNKAQYGFHYRNQILAHPEFIRRFGHLDIEYLKKALKTMNTPKEKLPDFSRV